MIVVNAYDNDGVVRYIPGTVRNVSTKVGVVRKSPTILLLLLPLRVSKSSIMKGAGTAEGWPEMTPR